MARALSSDDIAMSAAHLVALMRDKRFCLPVLTDELGDALDVLQAELDRAGLLSRYKQADGSLRMWGG